MIESKNIPIGTINEADIFFNPLMQGVTPFASTVDSSRLNMAAKYLNQTVPTKHAENPYVVTPEVHNATEINDHFKMIAEEDTFVMYYGNNVMIYYLNESKKLRTIYLPKYMDANGASYELLLIKRGPIKKGEVVYSYAPIDEDSMIPKLGYRTKTLYAPFFGFTTEDSYVISESFAKRAKHILHEKMFIPITKQFKYYKRFENWVPEIGDYVENSKGVLAFQPAEQVKNLVNIVSNLSPKESIIFSKKIAPKIEGYVRDVKVHKIAKDIDNRDEKHYNREFYEILDEMYNKQTYTISKEIESIIKQYINNPGISQRLIKGIMETHVHIHKLPKSALTNKFRHLLEDVEINDIDYLIEIDIVSENDTVLGDKFTTMYAGKGTVGLIVPDELMPKDENGEPFEVVINPVGIFGRNNWGVIFEAQLAKIIEDITSDILQNRKESAIDKLSFMIEKFIQHENPDLAKILQEQLLLIRSDENEWDIFKGSVEKNGLYLYGRAFSEFSYKEFIDLMREYENLFGINIVNKEKVKYNTKLLKWLGAIGMHSGAFDVAEYQEIEIEAFAGYNYIMKLYHTAASKYNMTNITGRYTYSGQPVRGKRNQGGTHASWQTLSAFLASGTTNILKELFTIKADALNEKQAFMTDMIRDKKYVLKEKYHSKTKTAIDVNLRILGLKFSSET